MAKVPFAKSTPYGVVEMNHATWTRDGRVPSQLPLSATDFASTRCENGMWLVYDEAAGVVRYPTAVTETVALVYSSEKDYGMIGKRGLGHFSLQVGEAYPRLGRPILGDKYTTNTFAYDDTEFANSTAFEAALAAYAQTPIYLVPQASSGIPLITQTVGSATTIARVIKVYTVPNGDRGIKVEFTKVPA